jgi:hypothetical protein
MKHLLIVLSLVILVGCADTSKVTAKQRDESMAHAGKMYSTSMLFYMNLPASR